MRSHFQNLKLCSASLFINIYALAYSPPPKITGDKIFLQDINAVFAHDSKIFVGTQKGLSISTNKGKTWTTKRQADGISDSTRRPFYLTNYYGPDSIMGVYAEGSTVYVLSFLGGLSISKDGGQNWINKKVKINRFAPMLNALYVDDGKIYVGTHTGGVFISTDQGDTWVSKGPGGISESIVLAVYAHGLNIYLGTQGGGLLISRDGGDTWSRKGFANGLSSYIISVVCASRDGVIYTSSDRGLSISYDGGNSFITKKDGLLDDLVEAIHVNSDGSHIYVVTYAGLYYSQNRGLVWKTKRLENGVGKMASSVYASEDGKKIYLGTNKGLVMSFNSGKTWTIKN